MAPAGTLASLIMYTHVLREHGILQTNSQSSSEGAFLLHVMYPRHSIRGYIRALLVLKLYFLHLGVTLLILALCYSICHSDFGPCCALHMPRNSGVSGHSCSSN